MENHWDLPALSVLPMTSDFLNNTDQNMKSRLKVLELDHGHLIAIAGDISTDS